jgi:phosphoadenosine phosphosulfate reductase
MTPNTQPEIENTAPFDRAILAEYRRAISTLSAQDCLRWACTTFPNDVVLASSLGAEDQVLLDMAVQAELLSSKPKLDAFTLDTGRLFPETLELLTRTESHYGVRFRVYYPDTAEVEGMVADAGIDLFRRSVEDRHRCCDVRKVQPLRRALKGRKLWVVGLRQDQNENRSNLERLTWDEPNGLLKLCPLLEWRGDDVTQYLDEHRVPHNELHDKGYPSIGCAPCTRAVASGEDARSGRWWWEQETARECGLHVVNGRLVRKR